MSPSLKYARISALAVESNCMVLLDFKKQISEDSLQIIRSWNDSTLSTTGLVLHAAPPEKELLWSTWNLKDWMAPNTFFGKSYLPYWNQPDKQQLVW
jgi:hypothetical protein